MKGLYLTSYNTNDTRSGVCKKIRSQVDVFRRNGFDMEIVDANSINFVETNVLTDTIRALFGNNGVNWQSLYKRVNEICSTSPVDFIYIRKPLLDTYAIDFFNELKSEYPKIKLLFEIPTYPYDNEIRLSQRIMWINDKINRNHLFGFTDRIVTYSSDKQIFGVKTINISNGIDYSKYKIRNPEIHKGINVVAVALFEKWHGYDRFLNGMYKQPEIVKSHNIHLWLAGKGRILTTYKKEVVEHGLQEYVHFLGEVHGADLDNLYNIADIALDCMGRHRVGCYYNSSLKGKEYCAYGVPIISGVETELDHNKDFEYYLRVPADDTIIDMNSVVNYYHRCYDDITPTELAEKIRGGSIGWFNFDIAFKPVIDYIKKLI